MTAFLRQKSGRVTDEMKENQGVVRRGKCKGEGIGWTQVNPVVDDEAYKKARTKGVNEVE